MYELIGLQRAIMCYNQSMRKKQKISVFEFDSYTSDIIDRNKQSFKVRPNQ